MMPIDRLFDLASGWSPRMAVWKEAWQMFATAPLLGVGFGQFAWYHFLQVSLADPAVVPGLFDHAHNLILQMLAELGVFAGAATWSPCLRGSRECCASRRPRNAGGCWPSRGWSRFTAC